MRIAFKNDMQLKGRRHVWQNNNIKNTKKTIRRQSQTKTKKENVNNKSRGKKCHAKRNKTELTCKKTQK